MTTPAPQVRSFGEEIGPPVPAFSWRPGHLETALVCASPHSGRRYPMELIGACRAPVASLRRLEDAYVDLLAEDAPFAGAGLLCAEVARAYVDLNREETELDPVMFCDWAEGGIVPAPRQSPRVAAGLGCLPRVGVDGREIYRRKLTRAEAAERLEGVYRPYHQRLADEMRQTATANGFAVLLDLHSMPSHVHGRPIGADMVIGDRYGASCAPVVIETAERLLRAAGFSVRRNSPYAGGHVTAMHGAPRRGRHVLQLEINRALYMDEATLEPHDGFARVRAALGDLFGALIGMTRRHARKLAP